MENVSEISGIEQLVKEKHELESALAKAQERVVQLESILEVVKEYYDIDFERTLGSRQLNELLEKII